MSTLRLLAHFGKYAFRPQYRAQFLCVGLAQRQQLLLNPTTSATQLVKFTPYASSHCLFTTKNSPDRAGKSDTKASPALAEDDIFGHHSKLGLFARFKLMYKKYWYVLIPVHVVTSIGWFSAFYYLSKSGVDIPALLQYMHFSESIIQKVQNSNTGHLAIAYLCYKIATPVRYAVTLGGTTISIKYLVQAGHIKPLPTKTELMQMYEQKKADRAAARADKLEEAEKARQERKK